MRKINKPRASTVASREPKMSMCYRWLSSCMEDSSVHVTSLKLMTAWRSYITAIPTQSASIRGLADSTYCLGRSSLALSNSEQLYAGKCCTRVLSPRHVHVHVFEWQLFCCHAFSAQPAHQISHYFGGQPKPGLLAMLPVSWYFFYLFVARTTLTLVKGTVTNHTNT